MTGRLFAFLGSGEFEDWHREIDRWLLARARGDGVLILPTASAREGDEVFDSWGEKGLGHYRRLGVPAEVLPLKTREDASRPELVEALDRAALVFVSGGNPWHLSETMRDTPFWERLCGRMEDHLAYAGCSAGVACLTETTYDSDTQDLESVWQPGLGYFRDVLFGPHWDIIDTWVPGASRFIVGSVRPGQTFVGIDEETAMVGDGSSWTVHGRQGVHVLEDGGWTTHRAGDAFELKLGRP